MLESIAQSTAATAGRMLDRLPWAAPVIATLGLLGWPWVAIFGGLAIYASTRGTYGFVAVVAAMAGVRGLYCAAGITARARHRARTIGDPTRYHEGWLYRAGDPVRGRDWMRCTRCRRRLRPGEQTVEGIAPVPAEPAHLPQVLREPKGMTHAGFPYCDACGRSLCRRQGDEAARAATLLQAAEAPPTPPPPRAPNRRLQRGSALALALSFVALVSLPSRSVVALVLLIAILVASLLGLGVARHGWALYAGNRPLLMFLSMALLALAVPLGLQLWSADHPQQEPIPGAVPLEPVLVDGAGPSGAAGSRLGRDNRSVDASMREREQAQDAIALTILARYEAGDTDVAWWRTEGAVSATKLAAQVRGYRADAVRIRDPVLRRRCLEMSAARDRYAGEIGRLQQAMARGSVGEAKLAALRARLAGDEAARLRAGLLVRDGAR